MSGAGEKVSETCKLVSSLVSTRQMQDLWHVNDAGMPVFVHTLDVTLLAIEGFEDWKSLYGSMDILAITLGSLLHDLTKATCRAHRRYTHSWVMSHQPEEAISEAMSALDSASLATGVAIDYLVAEHVGHIVASHHGPWGKITPATPEAALVHHCDLISAQHHRVAPVDANDILPLLSAGSTRSAAARSLGVSSSVLRARLLESCASEGADSVEELLDIWIARGRVQLGSPAREARIARARWLVDAAKDAPRSIAMVLETIGDHD